MGVERTGINGADSTLSSILSSTLTPLCAKHSVLMTSVRRNWARTLPTAARQVVTVTANAFRPKFYGSAKKFSRKFRQYARNPLAWRRVRRLAREHVTYEQQLARRVQEIIAGRGLIQADYSIGGGRCVHVPRVVSVSTASPVGLDIELLPGQIPEDFAAHAPAIAYNLGVAEVRVIPLGPSLIRLELLSEPDKPAAVIDSPVERDLVVARRVEDVSDPQIRLLAALRANTRSLTDTTGLARRTLLLDRSQLWEELAQTSTAALAQTYRNVASVCRQEADTLNTSAHSDLHGGPPTGM